MSNPKDVSIQLLREEDLEEAVRILRLAFGTFLGLPDPTQMFADRQMLTNRWRSNHSSVFGAYLGNELVGSNVATKWGSFAYFGPLSVRPDLWDKGIAKQLMKHTMGVFSKWRTTHEGLFTFPQSPKHVGLYQKFGFNARFLTAIMVKAAGRGDNGPGVKYDVFSRNEIKEQEEILKQCSDLTDSMYSGLDLSSEIRAVQNLKLGDTALVKEDSRIAGFAVCHVGANTEAGSDTCYVKFGASKSSEGFIRLLKACETFAAERGVSKLEAGVNLARSKAYEEMIYQGFRTDFLGVAMQRQNEEGFNRPDVFAMDDWR